MERVHKHLRELAITLNALCIVEVAVVVFYSWLAYDLLEWYKLITIPEQFNATAYWAAISGIVATIFTAVKHINDSAKATGKASRKKASEEDEDA